MTKGPEGEPTPQELREKTELIEKPELTQEQRESIDQKRETLLMGDEIVIRFVSLPEYFHLLEEGEITEKRGLEANKTNFVTLRNIRDEASQRMFGGLWADKSLFQDKIGGGTKPGDYSETWSAIADEYTNWTASSIQIRNYQALLHRYQEIIEEVKNTGGSRDESRERFGRELLEGAKEHIYDLVENKHWSSSNDEVDESELMEKLQKPNQNIAEIDREALVRILNTDPSELSKDDIRVLMRYNRNPKKGIPLGDRRAFQVMLIWDKSAFQKKEWDLFGNIPQDTKTDKLLGALMLYPDNTLCKKAARQMAKSSKDEPSSAHAIIGINGEEWFPNSGTDFVFYEREVAKRGRVEVTDEEAKKIREKLKPKEIAKAKDPRFLRVILGRLYYREATSIIRENSSKKVEDVRAEEYYEGCRIMLDEEIDFFESLLQGESLLESLKISPRTGTYLEQNASRGYYEKVGDNNLEFREFPGKYSSITDGVEISSKWHSSDKVRNEAMKKAKKKEKEFSES